MTSLKEDKIHALVSKLLTENHKKDHSSQTERPILFYIVELFIVLKFNLKSFRNAQFYENVCYIVFTRLSDFMIAIKV